MFLVKTEWGCSRQKHQVLRMLNTIFIAVTNFHPIVLSGPLAVIVFSLIGMLTTLDLILM